MDVTLGDVESALLSGRLRQAVTALATLDPALPMPANWRQLDPLRDAGVELRADHVLAWLDEHARGHGLAAHCLALLNEHGQYVDKQLRQAITLYERAMAAGVIESIYKLGSLYLHGNNVYGEVAQGAELLRNAAAMGHARAAHVLGSAFFRGQLIARNFSRGYLFLRLAAELGNEDSKRAVVIIETMHPRESFAWEKGQVAAILQNYATRRAQFHQAACEATRLAMRKQDKAAALRMGRPAVPTLNTRAYA